MDHISRIVDALEERDLDAMLVTGAVSERYALDFCGEGVALLSRRGCRYFTDSRYIEAAQKRIAGAEIAVTGGGRSHWDLAAEAVSELGLERVGFESDTLSVDEHERIREKLPCTLVPAGELIPALRAAKDAGELGRMRRAQAITDETFAAMLELLRPGLTEREIAARLVYEMTRRGASGPSFDPIAASGPNGSMPHAVPGERALQTGDFLTLDFGCIVDGYCSDMTRTVAIGPPTDEMRRVYDTVLSAQRAGIAAARAGVAGSAPDAAARGVITQAGYGEYFGHAFGHSLGVEIHESPNFSPRETALMPEGAAVSAEPGIYLPGRFGVRIEDVVILTPDGCEDITKSPKDLIVL